MNPFDRWFIECGHDGLWAVWLARHDEDPIPCEFATLHDDGRITVVTHISWPLPADQLGEAMFALYSRHVDCTRPALRAIREARP